jgi:hypothetical protein
MEEWIGDKYIEKVEDITDGWQRICTTKYRERRRFSFFPWIVVSGFDTDYHWTGKWFQFVTIKEQLCEERHDKFDDGWTYTSYWGPWKKVWRLKSIVK